MGTLGEHDPGRQASGRDRVESVGDGWSESAHQPAVHAAWLGGVVALGSGSVNMNRSWKSGGVMAFTALCMASIASSFLSSSSSIVATVDASWRSTCTESYNSKGVIQQPRAWPTPTNQQRKCLHVLLLAVRCGDTELRASYCRLPIRCNQFLHGLPKLTGIAPCSRSAALRWVARFTTA